MVCSFDLILVKLKHLVAHWMALRKTLTHAYICTQTLIFHLYQTFSRSRTWMFAHPFTHFSLCLSLSRFLFLYLSSFVKWFWCSLVSSGIRCIFNVWPGSQQSAVATAVTTSNHFKFISIWFHFIEFGFGENMRFTPNQTKKVKEKKHWNESTEHTVYATI